MLEEMVGRQPPSGGIQPVPRLPVHRSESPTGYSSEGCSQQSPLPLHRSPTKVAQSRSGEAMKCATRLHCRNVVKASVRYLPEPTYGSTPDVLRPRHTFGCDTVAPVASAANDSRLCCGQMILLKAFQELATK
jgi:hypothetical protein